MTTSVPMLIALACLRWRSMECDGFHYSLWLRWLLCWWTASRTIDRSRCRWLGRQNEFTVDWCREGPLDAKSDAYPVELNRCTFVERAVLDGISIFQGHVSHVRRVQRGVARCLTHTISGRIVAGSFDAGTSPLRYPGNWVWGWSPASGGWGRGCCRCPSAEAASSGSAMTAKATSEARAPYLTLVWIVDCASVRRGPGLKSAGR